MIINDRRISRKEGFEERTTPNPDKVWAEVVPGHIAELDRDFAALLPTLGRNPLPLEDE